jgi:hypothetical protein
MSAFRFVSLRARWAVPSLAICSAFVIFAAFSSSSAAGMTPSTVNLCITKAGPEKGTVRFVSTNRCRRGEIFVHVVTASATQGVMGVQEESNPWGESGEEAPSGEEGAIADSFLVAGMTTGDASQSVPNYVGPFMGFSPTPTELNAQQPMPFAGKVANFGFKVDVPPGSGNSYTMTVRKNGVAASPAISCKIEGTGSSNTSCLDHAHSLSFAAGDLLSVQIVPRGNPDRWGGARWSATLNP